MAIFWNKNWSHALSVSLSPRLLSVNLTNEDGLTISVVVRTFTPNRHNAKRNMSN